MKVFVNDASRELTMDELHELSMDWGGCYYSDGETERPLDDDNVHDLDQAVKVWLSPEEDAPDDYLVILKECRLDDGTVFPKGGAIGRDRRRNRLCEFSCSCRGPSAHPSRKGAWRYFSSKGLS